MTDFFGFDLDSLEDHVDAQGRFRPPEKKVSANAPAPVQYACEACGGTKVFRSWSGRVVGKCNACRGRGYFVTSPQVRAKARADSASAKARRLEETQAAFREQYPEILPFLEDAARWSEFAQSLLGDYRGYGHLSEKQVDAVRRMIQKVEDRRAADAARKSEEHAEVDLAPIRQMFEAAVASGYKRPTYRAAGLEISRAPDTGRNPGALYVVSAESGEYLGKILGTSYTGKSATGLAAIAADPRGEAVRYGQRTGTCSCCGRTLTNHASIEAGIGPICASKWGL